jgi:uncharacterized membrane-anchored protein YitT (DUF2179 family)
MEKIKKKEERKGKKRKKCMCVGIKIHLEDAYSHTNNAAVFIVPKPLT